MKKEIKCKGCNKKHVVDLIKSGAFSRPDLYTYVCPITKGRFYYREGINNK